MPPRLFFASIDLTPVDDNECRPCRGVYADASAIAVPQSGDLAWVSVAHLSPGEIADLEAYYRMLNQLDAAAPVPASIDLTSVDENDCIMISIGDLRTYYGGLSTEYQGRATVHPHIATWISEREVLSESSDSDEEGIEFIGACSDPYFAVDDIEFVHNPDFDD